MTHLLAPLCYLFCISNPESEMVKAEEPALLVLKTITKVDLWLILFLAALVFQR